MKRVWSTSLIFSLLVVGCGNATNKTIAAANEEYQERVLAGQWIVEADGSIMVDPQTSGLTPYAGKLYTISDASAQKHQRLRLHVIDPSSATLSVPPPAMKMARRVRNSCFASYLADEPDLEALVADPLTPGVFYTVTEDATRSGALSDRCQRRFQNTGSTDYPTLLVRVELNDDGQAVMTHVRPLQYSLDYAVGDFPNDGIEGMAIGKNRTLYLGLERDDAGNPRIFSVTLEEDFWQSTDFAMADEPELLLPTFTSGRHPINGLAFYQPEGYADGFLLAAARNDNELWIIDAAGQLPTRIMALQFSAPSGDPSGDPTECGEFEVMDNASIEGLAVLGENLWLINDPWKKNYLKNVQCAANQQRYESFAPLLFSLPLSSLTLPEQ